MTLVTDSAVLLQLCEASAVNETARGVRFGALIASVLYLLHLDRVLGQT
ncbi:hypothetical protein ALO46_00733 [Pseudomonas syringae pv. solidagae]|nr:hypothetical protein ALO46_00733 [Pseudomonas syringae pv. solidagae]SOP98040.1 hypothetical protein CFBP2118_01815 [Pseudomonas syringae pv. syringae]